MGLTSVGAEAFASAIIGDGDIPLFDSSNCYIGVGDDSTAFASGQTALQAEENSGGNAFRKGMDFGYPLRDPDGDGSDNKVRFKATFDTDEGNFHWQEWAIFNADETSDDVMLCRVVEDLGVKTSADSWVFQIDITISGS